MQRSAAVVLQILLDSLSITEESMPCLLDLQTPHSVSHALISGMRRANVRDAVLDHTVLVRIVVVHEITTSLVLGDSVENVFELGVAGAAVRPEVPSKVPASRNESFI